MFLLYSRISSSHSNASLITRLSLQKKIGKVEPGNTQMEKCTLAQLSHSTHCPEPHTWGQEVEKGWQYHTYTVWSQ